VLGHQVVGRIESLGAGASAFSIGDRVDVAWIFLRLDYPAHLWLEKEIKRVANVARRDVRELLEIAAEVPLLPEVEEFPLEEANRALAELKERRIRGAKVLRVTAQSG
jgi:D-arabinose 1-dehydrogenase-like Zn-dependent alcohol dehydrogenase